MFTDETPGAVASIVCSPEAREQFARKSVDYKCKVCGCCHRDLVLGEKSVKAAESAKGAENVSDCVRGPESALPVQNSSVQQCVVKQTPESASQSKSQPQAEPPRK